ncbi:hypothetical protein [Streptomyces sp. 4F14]|uniref:hypothetical protein n=1 Tax=Streptomyces sp. 4F14 TaxID=3394380 RepID=UPI003A89F554
MHARGGRVAVAAGAAALALLAGPGAWAAQGEAGAGAETGAGSGSGAGPGSGAGEVPGTGTAPEPGTKPAPEPGTGSAPEPGTKPAPGTGTAPEPGTKPAPEPGTKPGPGAAPAPVDVVSRLYPDDDLIAPGRLMGIRAIASVETGSVTKLGLTLKLPVGVTYVKNIDDAANAVCKPSADGRSVTCVPARGLELLSAQVQVRVGADVAPGTELAFTTTADIGDAVDSKPENNVASAKVTVKVPADLGIEWTTAPKGLVKVGEEVPTEVTVTNHGPGPVRASAAHLDIGYDYWPELGYDPACQPDIGVLYCAIDKDLERGESVTFAFTWKFPKKAAGTTYRVPTRIYSSSPLDDNRANDRTELVFRFAKTPKPTPTPTPTPTPSATPQPSASPSSVPSPAGGGGALAETGAGVPVAGLAVGAGALVVTGGALVVRRRRSS